MTGLRADSTRLKQKLGKLRQHLRAERFKPDVLDYTRKCLATSSRNTPVRELSVIRENQIGKPNSQYDRWQHQGGRGVARSAFLSARAPARFLYRASWGQCARSLGLDIAESADVLSATTRRNPEEQPPQGYGQIRGGKDVISVVIYNPFLEIPSRYKLFSGKQIMADALAKHRPNFIRKVQSRMRVICYSIFAKHG